MHHLGSEQDERKTEGILSLQAFSQWKKQGENRSRNIYIMLAGVGVGAAMRKTTKNPD